jgi:2-(1,2-epoxy-1,2-dihydrophenyl)acetyl-CoA isomerase
LKHLAGLVDLLAEAGEVQATALALASQIAAGPPIALASLKHGMFLAAGTMDAVAEFEAAAMTVALVGREVKEGVAAFKERRAPRFHEADPLHPGSR